MYSIGSQKNHVFPPTLKSCVTWWYIVYYSAMRVALLSNFNEFTQQFQWIYSAISMNLVSNFNEFTSQIQWVCTSTNISFVSYKNQLAEQINLNYSANQFELLSKSIWIAQQINLNCRTKWPSSTSKVLSVGYLPRYASRVRYSATVQQRRYSCDIYTIPP